MKNPICQATINPTLLLGVQGTLQEVVVTMKEAVAVEEEDLVVRCNLTVKQISLVHLYIQPFFAFCRTSPATLYVLPEVDLPVTGLVFFYLSLINKYSA